MVEVSFKGHQVSSRASEHDPDFEDRMRTLMTTDEDIRVQTGDDLPDFTIERDHTESCEGDDLRFGGKTIDGYGQFIICGNGVCRFDAIDWRERNAIIRGIRAAREQKKEERP